MSIPPLTIEDQEAIEKLSLRLLTNLENACRLLDGTDKFDEPLYNAVIKEIFHRAKVNPNPIK